MGVIHLGQRTLHTFSFHTCQGARQDEQLPPVLTESPRGEKALALSPEQLMMLLEDKCLSSRGFIQRIMDLKPSLGSRDHGHCRAQGLGKSKSHIWVCCSSCSAGLTPWPWWWWWSSAELPELQGFIPGGFCPLSAAWMGLPALSATGKLPLVPPSAGQENSQMWHPGDHPP